MAVRNLKRERIMRPQLPIRKPPKKGKSKVVSFMKVSVRDEQSYVILATEQDLHQVMVQWLVNRKYGLVEVKGGYRLRDGSNKMVVEDAVLVQREVACKLWANGWIDTQESVLHLYHLDILGRYKAELCFINDIKRENIDLGVFVRATKEKALSNSDGYTYKPLTNEYYIVI